MGPLQGVRIVEFAGIGPGPFAAMMLADHGAEVIRVDRPGAVLQPLDPLIRSRRSIVVNMKSVDGISLLRNLLKGADGLIEGFRPGVMERLGLGPDLLLADNPKLVYGRMTGWGQYGPLAQAAGHDINYISLTGLLHSVGTVEKPIPPVNYLGDFGGGGMMLAFGMVCALLAVRGGAPGQVIDAAMTDGSAVLASFVTGWMAANGWTDQRGTNLLDGGSPFYDSYRCSDGLWVSVGPLEPQFYALFTEKLGLRDDPAFGEQKNKGNWGRMRERLTAIFAARARHEWCEILEGTDACFAPILSMTEAPTHPHNVARGTYIQVGNGIQPAPAPRYSATPAAAPRYPGTAGSDTNAILADLGYEHEAIAEMRQGGVLG